MDYIWEGDARDDGFECKYTPGIITVIISLKRFSNPKTGKHGIFAEVSDGYKTTGKVLWNYNYKTVALRDLKFANFLDNFDLLDADV